GQADPSGPDGAGVPRAEADGPSDGGGDRAARAAPGAGGGGHQGTRASRGGVGREQLRRRTTDAMGQKVHPYGFRLGFNKTWRSRWFAGRDYATLLHEDLKLRQTLKKRFAHAGVSKIDIERAANKLKIDIHTS